MSAPASSSSSSGGAWAVELGALAAQCAVFFVGMVVSIVIGMVLGKALSGPGGLLVATVVAGTGLLIAAALSQTLHDWLIQRSLDQTEG